MVCPPRQLKLQLLRLTLLQESIIINIGEVGTTPSKALKASLLCNLASVARVTFVLGDKTLSTWELEHITNVRNQKSAALRWLFDPPRLRT